MMKFKQFLFENESLKDWQNYTNRIPMLKAGVEVLKKLGGNSFIVGGTIRDLITGEKAPDDIDIATDVPMDKIESMFTTHDIGANKDFGIVVAKYKGFDFEIAQFRKDVYEKPKYVRKILD